MPQLFLVLLSSFATLVFSLPVHSDQGLVDLENLCRRVLI